MTAIDPKKLTTVLATDCGSTTTKAILFEKLPQGWRATVRGEAPTTVEKPVADVTIGAVNAFSEVEELSGRKLLNDETPGEASPLIIKSSNTDSNGVDLYVSTSSAGGGLQMIVAGVVSTMTTESAERAALGAGAIVMDAISIDDGREPHERVSKIRHLRPDIILIAGGVDGGTVDHPLELSETILQAEPRARFGDTLRLPVIYAANIAARDEAKHILEKRFEFVAVDNIRPSLETENLAPARDAIHELFLNHVMSHAPGYKKLLSWTPVPIQPTPAAVGDMVLAAAKRSNIQIVAVDIGGATTDVFSALRSLEDSSSFIFNRTVSANLGMSYSVANVLLEAGVDNIARWIPFDLSATEINNRLRNKMIRPTTIPQTVEDLILEQAVCREALRLAFSHHKRLAVGLRGMQQRRTIADMFRQTKSGESLVDMMTLDLIIGSGGVLSHAPNRASAALMLLDAFEPLGFTRLAVDSVFMMPHLGVFATVHPEAATEIFVNDCLIELGTAITPVGAIKPGAPILEVTIPSRDNVVLRGGELRRIELPPDETFEVTAKPLNNSINVGAGAGEQVKKQLLGGQVGLMLDGRGRPLTFAQGSHERRRQLTMQYNEFGLSLPMKGSK